jgi:hypothetical protein
MQTTCGDNDSEGISELSRSESAVPAEPEQDDRFKAGPSGISAHPPEKNNDAAADMLNRRRIDALRTLDESSFSCVADLARGVSPAHCTMQLLSFQSYHGGRYRFSD